MKWSKEYKTGGGYTAGELPRAVGDNIEFFGIAIFDGPKMVGKLNGDESRYMMMARGEFERGFLTFQDPMKPKYAVPIDVRSARKPKVKIT